MWKKEHKWESIDKQRNWSRLFYRKQIKYVKCNELRLRLRHNFFFFCFKFIHHFHFDLAMFPRTTGRLPVVNELMISFLPELELARCHHHHLYTCYENENFACELVLCVVVNRTIPPLIMFCIFCLYKGNWYGKLFFSFFFINFWLGFECFSPLWLLFYTFCSEFEWLTQINLVR